MLPSEAGIAVCVSAELVEVPPSRRAAGPLLVAGSVGWKPEFRPTREIRDRSRLHNLAMSRVAPQRGHTKRHLRSIGDTTTLHTNIGPSEYEQHQL